MSTTVESARLEVTTNADEYAGQVKKIEGSTKGMSANLGRSALEASRAIEDLQYGIGGVVNNIPGLVSALGGGAAAMAAFSLAAVGIAQVAKHWDELITSFETRSTIPQAAGDLSGLQKELEKARDRMKELGERSTVTLAQLGEYNGLRQKTANIEKQIADEQERQNRAKAFDALKPAGATQAEAVRSDTLKPLFGDPQNAALVNAIKDALPNDKLKGLQGQLAGVDRDRQMQMDLGVDFRQPGALEWLKAEAERIKQEIAREGERSAREAKDLAAQAVLEGKEESVKRILDLMAKRPDAFTDLQRSAFDQVSDQEVKEKVRAPMRADDAKRMAKLNEDLQKKEDAATASANKASEEEAANEAEMAQFFADKDKKAAEDKKKHELESKQKQIGAMNDRENAAIKSSGIDLMAEQLLARTREAGGARDSNGNFQPMNSEQITAFVNREVEKYLHRQIGVDRFGRPLRANPGMDREETEGLAVRITSQANDRFQKDMTALSGQGLTQQQATQQIVANTQALLVQMANQVQGIAAGNARLEAENERIRQFMTQPGPIRLPGGR